MILLPRPRIPFLIALALAIPTYGVSLGIFYFAFKRPHDSVAASAILAAAKLSMQTRRAGQLFNVNRAAIERVFAKFSDPTIELKYGIGAPFIRWGVLSHPMLNAGRAFTLRVDRRGGTVNVEASPGEAWWLLTDRVWLGRRGTAPGLPASLYITVDHADEDVKFDDPENAAIGLLILELADAKAQVELSSLTYGRISDFVESHQLGAEWFPDYVRMYFFVDINKQTFSVNVTNLDPDKENAGGIRISASVHRMAAMAEAG
jgi:hypothetical protein